MYVRQCTEPLLDFAMPVVIPEMTRRLSDAATVLKLIHGNTDELPETSVPSRSPHRPTGTTSKHVEKLPEQKETENIADENQRLSSKSFYGGGSNVRAPVAGIKQQPGEVVDEYSFHVKGKKVPLSFTKSAYNANALNVLKKNLASLKKKPAKKKSLSDSYMKTLQAKTGHRLGDKRYQKPPIRKRGKSIGSSTELNHNKFFKHRSAPHSLEQENSPGIIVGKGFNLKFQPKAINWNAVKEVEFHTNLKRKSLDNNVAPVKKLRIKLESSENSEVSTTSSPDLFLDSSHDDKVSLVNEGKGSQSATPDQYLQDGKLDCEGSKQACAEADDHLDTESISSCTDSVLLLSAQCSDVVTESEMSDTHEPNDLPKETPDSIEMENKPKPAVIMPQDKFYPLFTAKRSPSSPYSSSSSCSSPQVKSSKLKMLSSPRCSPRIARAKILSPKRSPRLLRGSHDKTSNEQMILDAGQKLVGMTQCAKCGMTYTVGEPDDETMHSRFHQRTLGALKFPGWKKERVTQEFLDGSRILVVMPEENPEKINAIRKVMDEDLGFSESSTRANSKAFLCISSDKRVIGCCLAELISQGNRVLPEEQDKENTAVTGRRPWCCKTQPEKAKCGINRIWVLRGERRKGIATKLLESVRMHFLMGMVVDKDMLAFSDPTPDGKLFATKYMDTQAFLVYKFN